MKTRITRSVLVVAATTLWALTMTATPAAAHAVRHGNDVVFGDISANHRNLNVCRLLAGGGITGAWITLRYANPSGPGEQLIRYDSPAFSGVCAGYSISPTNLANIRACFSNSAGNYCTAWARA